MKRIEIIVPNRRLNEVNRILKAANVVGVSYHQIEGRGRGKAQPITVGRGIMRYTPEFIPRLKIEMVVRDGKVEELITKIVDKIGGDPSVGAKIFVTDVPFAVDLATKQSGEAAI